MRGRNRLAAQRGKGKEPQARTAKEEARKDQREVLVIGSEPLEGAFQKISRKPQKKESGVIVERQCAAFLRLEKKAVRNGRLMLKRGEGGLTRAGGGGEGGYDDPHLIEVSTGKKA